MQCVVLTWTSAVFYIKITKSERLCLFFSQLTRRFEITNCFCLIPFKYSKKIEEENVDHHESLFVFTVGMPFKLLIQTT